jgi:hypothetical protein
MFAAPAASRNSRTRSLHFAAPGETSNVVRLFLDAVVHHKFQIDAPLADLGNLLRLLYKWLCSTQFKLVINSVRWLLANGEMGSLQVFVIGAHAAQLTLCHDAIQANTGAHDAEWRVDAKLPEPFDPNNWRRRFWENGPCPSDIWVAALMGAWRETSVNGRLTERFYPNFEKRILELNQRR